MQFCGDRPHGLALAVQVSDVQALVLRQVAASLRGRGKGTRPGGRLVGLAPGPGLLDAEPPPVTGLAVDSDDPTRLAGAVSLVHQGKIRRPLVLELFASLR